MRQLKRWLQGLTLVAALVLGTVATVFDSAVAYDTCEGDGHTCHVDRPAPQPDEHYKLLERY